MKNSCVQWIGIIILGCAAGLSFGQTPAIATNDFIQCASRTAVTGRETPLIEFIKSRLPQGAVSEIDNMGNLIVRLGSAAPELLVATSVDEPGFLVTDITDDGYLRVASPGGRPPGPLFLQFHEGHYVDILTRNGPVRGVVSLPSSHLVRGRRDSLSLDRFLIDIGARSQEEAVARGVEMLDPAAAVKDLAVLAGNRIAGPMLSRKVGAFALLEALKAYRAGSGKGIVLAWATQGAMSNSGMARLARRFSPKQVLLIGGFVRGGARAAKDPVEVLGSGVLVPDGESPGGSGALLRAATAAAAGKIRIIPSPAGAFPEARALGGDADSCGVGIPVLFPGTLVETIDFHDLQELIGFIGIVLQM